MVAHFVRSWVPKDRHPVGAAEGCRPQVRELQTLVGKVMSLLLLGPCCFCVCVCVCVCVHVCVCACICMYIYILLL